MSMKNLARDVEIIALALSEEGGYEYYHIDDDLKELAKNVSDMQAENAKLRELVEDMLDCIDIQIAFERVPARWMQDEFAGRARELGIEVDE